MVYDVYFWNKLIGTYQSLNKANAALHRQDRHAPIRSVSFVKARVPRPGNRAPITVRRKVR